MDGQFEPVRKNEHRSDGAGPRIDAQRADASGRDQSEVAVSFPGRSGRLAYRAGQLSPRIGYLKRKGPGRPLESSLVCVEAKWNLVIEADTLEDAVTTEQSMIEDRNRGCIRIDE